MTKNKLTFQSMFLQDKKVKRSIVDLLTQNDVRTCVSFPREPGRIISDIIGINSMSDEGPVKLWNGYNERGLIDPKNENVLYFIDSEKKKIIISDNDVNLLYDQDKVRNENRYVWQGAFQDILNEFQNSGYELVNHRGKR